MNNRKKILICPLDWGLGHATRCIPLIAYLLEKNCEVIVAGNDMTNNLVSAEFPSLQYVLLQGYNVKYSAAKWTLPFVLLKQSPRLLKTVKKENLWLQEIIDTHKIDIVISDNRYGLFSDKAKCIFITHQLQIAVPQSETIEGMINSVNHKYIRNFSAVWVPDYEDNIQAGNLSDKKTLEKVTYIGNLSRFERKENVPKKYDIAIILSGPEPQRTILENIILKQECREEYNILLVRGKPHAKKISSPKKQMKIINFLSKNDMENAMLQSEIIMCRSGYSTIMDLIKLNKNAVLIPTPGQTEQEYLAQYLSEKKWFVKCKQDGFSLQEAITDFHNTMFKAYPQLDMQLYKKAIDELLIN